eukprot:3414373-Karenia_brevis.AAC.1
MATPLPKTPQHFDLPDQDAPGGFALRSAYAAVGNSSHKQKHRPGPYSSSPSINKRVHEDLEDSDQEDA